MKDIDAWIYFDGPEPEHLRPLLDALRDRSSATSHDKEQLSRRFFERLDAALSQRSEQPVAPDSQLAQAADERPTDEDGASTQSPAFDRRSAAPVPAAPVPADPPGQRGGLPFKPRAPERQLEVTEEVPVYDPRKGETAQIREDSVMHALAASPFAGNTVGWGRVPFPQLSLEAYASLLAELSVLPERSAMILPRYHVMNEAARRALDEHWQRHLAASPETRLQFENTLRTYTAWVRARGR